MGCVISSSAMKVKKPSPYSYTRNLGHLNVLRMKKNNLPHSPCRMTVWIPPFHGFFQCMNLKKISGRMRKKTVCIFKNVYFKMYILKCISKIFSHSKAFSISLENGLSFDEFKNFHNFFQILSQELHILLL